MKGEYKAPGQKLVVADIETEDQRLAKVQLSGDFFIEPDEALTRMNEALQGASTSASAAQLAARVEEALLPTDGLLGISPLAVGIAIRRALGSATSWDDLHLEVIHGPMVDPAINVALDEILPEEVAAGRRRPFLRIWEWDGPQVVMGSFQSYENEIDQEGIDKHGITVTRRVSGGGAMFMEPGNCITYSLVVPVSLVDGLSFQESYPFLDEWVMEALAMVGVNAKYVPLNDIASDKGKIAGAAQKRFANGILLHHVTMAYDIDAQKMNECLRIGKEKIKDKGLRSAVKRVDPMRSQTGLPRQQIIEQFLQHFQNKYQAGTSQITEEELAAARGRVQDKFATPQWTHRIP